MALDEDIARLVREARLLDAASLARHRSQWSTAADLYERACAWEDAARSALEDADYERALALAAEGGVDAVAERALAHMTAGTTRRSLADTAAELLRRGHGAWAARVYEAAGEARAAATAWQRAGDFPRAARLLEGLGGPAIAEAAAALEAGLRREPERADLLLALGALLLRADRPTVALRALQRVPDGAAEKTEALRLCVEAVTRLGMNDARAEIQGELAARGVSTSDTPRPLDEASQGRAVGATARLYGRYEIVREVSSTGTSRVLECRDVLRDDRVAVKVFAAHPEVTRGGGRDALARFLREAQILGRLIHPNIVPLRDVASEPPGLVLEWMPGGSLAERLARAVLSPLGAVEVACAVLAALGEAHRLGVLHRDIKPDNVLFDASGTARLSDFGVAHLADLSVTATAGSFGTLAYMSPEQREGRPASVASDLYGVGVVLREMLGEGPPRGVPDVRPPLATLHPALDERHDAAVAELLARDPRDRPRGAFEAARKLRALPWPSGEDTKRATPSKRPSANPSAPPLEPSSNRLDAAADDGHGRIQAEDRWLARAVTLVPLTPHSLAMARAFALAGHPSLQTVLRVDRDAGMIWLGRPVAREPDRPLTTEERGHIERVLALVRSHGAPEGSVDARRVTLTDDGPVVLFPVE